MTDLVYIAKRQLEMKDYDELSCRHWLMFFRDPETSTTLAYDAKDPQDCYRAIKAKHPNFVFLEVRGCDTVSSAVEYAKAFRLVAKVQLWLESRLKVKADIEALENTRPSAPPPTAA